MFDIIVKTSSVLVIILSLQRYYQIAGGFNISELNIYSYFFYMTLVLTIIGTIILGIDITNHYFNRAILNKGPTEVKTLAITAIVFYLIPLIILIITKITNKYNFLKNDSTVNGYSSKTKEKMYLHNRKNIMVKIVYLIFFAVSFISIIYVFFSIGLENVPVINLLQGKDSDTLLRLRQEVGRNFSGNAYIKNILALTFMPLLCYISYVFKKKSLGLFWKKMFYITLVLSIVILTYDLQKAVVVRFLFSFIFFQPFFSKKTSKKKKVLFLLLILIVLLLLFYLITPVNFSQFFSFKYGPFNRIFKTQAFSSFVHFDVFPSRHPYLNGASFPGFLTTRLLGVESVRSAKILMEITRPDAVSAGIAGVMNGFYIGEAYANFSYIGVFVFTFIVSLELFLIHRIFLFKKLTPLSLVLYVYLMNYFVNITQGGAIDFIYNPTFTIVILIFFVLDKLYIKFCDDEINDSMNCVVHLPYRLDYSRQSGPHLRPQQIIQSLKDNGYNVEVIEGESEERKNKIKAIKNQLRNGKKFDFVYSESNTMPTALTDADHKPRNFNLDFHFFEFMRNEGVKIGLFYRDVYWRYPEYNENVSFLKRIIAKTFYLHDLLKYNRLIDVFYVPSMGYTTRLPFDLSMCVKTLPPGIEQNLISTMSMRKNETATTKLVNIFYVGGVNEMYDIEELVSAVHDNKNFELVICTRKADWENNKSKYSKYLNDRISIVHKNQDELFEYYERADILSLAIKPNDYRDMAVPIKLFEYIAVGKPILSYKNSWTGDFVSKNNLGFSVSYGHGELSELFDKLELSSILYKEGFSESFLKIQKENLWRNRGEQIIKDLTQNNRAVNSDTENDTRPVVCLLSDASNAHTRKWVREIKSNGYNVIVISLNDGVIEETEVISLGETNQVKRSYFSKISYFMHIPKIKKELNRINPDVIHVQYLSSYGFLTAVSTKNFILNVWGKDVYDFPKHNIVTKLMTKFVLKRAGKIYSTSNVMKEVTQEYTKKEIGVSPFGVDINLFTPGDNSSSNSFTFGYIKLIEEKYGIKNLIICFKRIVDSYPQNSFKLVIVGRGTQKDEMIELVSNLGLRDKVDFIDYLNGQNEVIKVYNSFDVAVFPSMEDSESFGVSAVEAMACGVATIVSDVSGFKEVSSNGEVAIMYDRNNLDALYESMCKLFEDDEFRNNLAIKGRNNVVEKYDIKNNFKEVFNDYSAMTERKRKEYEN